MSILKEINNYKIFNETSTKAINLPPYVIWHEPPTLLSSVGFDCIIHMSTFAVLYSADVRYVVNVVDGFVNVNLSYALSYSAQKTECFDSESDDATETLEKLADDDRRKLPSELLSHAL